MTVSQLIKDLFISSDLPKTFLNINSILFQLILFVYKKEYFLRLSKLDRRMNI